MSDKATILAVDDNEEMLSLMVEILAAEGYQVYPADSGEQALAAVTANPPDLILLDVRMKGIGGLEVCRRLKMREEMRQIPIILISGLADTKEWVEGLRLGAADYVTKPFRAQELLTRVKTHLTLNRMNVSLEQQSAKLRSTIEQLQSEILNRQSIEGELRRSLDRAERSRRAMLSTLEDQKRAEEALREKNLELGKTYEELREKQEMILQQEKMASIGMLAAGIAHEIKNPLAIILQGINYLQTAITDNSLMTEVVERLNKAVVRADTIVKGLLSYARQNPLSLVEQDMLSLIDESLLLTEHEFRAKKIQLIKEYRSDLPKVPVDSNQMKQVFVNLIINGIDAMPPKGRFVISVQQIEDSEGKNVLQINFNDTGHGIPADKITNIFDPFYTTKPPGNTGLGLSISRGIIDKHGGVIHAESEIGQGTSIIIKLPIPDGGFWRINRRISRGYDRRKAQI